MELPTNGPGGQAHEGCIELVIGPMFSEKSTEMISRIRRAALADQSALIIKHRDDVRYEDGNAITTHAGLCQRETPRTESLAPVRIIAVRALSEAVVTEEVIGIDEGQFYPDLIEYCEKWASEGRRVIVAALDGDFARRPFGRVCELIPLCESVEKRRGVCMVCRRRASAFTLRLNQSTALIEIGAQESYRSACRRCYFIK
jgi:thymidine kinase